MIVACPCQGLLSDSVRKCMEAMLAHVTEPGSYQAFQHFITDAPWDTECVWRRLRTLIPEREGVLIFDGTSFAKQGKHSVGVARASTAGPWERSPIRREARFLSST